MKKAIELQGTSPKTHSDYRLLFSVFAGLFLLFLCSAPVFYMFVYSGVYIYLGLKILRFLLAVTGCCLLRGKQKEVLVHHPDQRKKIFFAGIVCIVICFVLSVGGTVDKFYYGLSQVLGVLPGRVPDFVVVLWEQLFSSEFLWTVLICCILVFSPVTKRNGHSESTKAGA